MLLRSDLLSPVGTSQPPCFVDIVQNNALTGHVSTWDLFLYLKGFFETKALLQISSLLRITVLNLNLSLEGILESQTSSCYEYRLTRLGPGGVFLQKEIKVG